MKRRQAIACLRAHGLSVDVSTGSGDAKIVTTGKREPVYVHFSYGKSDLSPGAWSGIKKCAARKDIKLPTYSAAKSGEWLIKKDPPKRKRGQKKAQYERQADNYLSIALAADLLEVDFDWLKAALADELADSLWDTHVEEKALFSWWEGLMQTYVPLNKGVVDHGLTHNKVLYRVQNGEIPSIPRFFINKTNKRAKGRKVYYVPDVALAEMAARRGDPVVATPSSAKVIRGAGYTGPLDYRPIKIVKFTPEKAYHWLEAYNLADIQRQFDQRNYDDLQDAFNQGRFHGGHLLLAVYNGKKYLLDGQHYLSILVYNKASMGTAVVEVHVKSKEELLSAYHEVGKKGGVRKYTNSAEAAWLTHNPPCDRKFAGRFSLALSHLEHTVDRSTGEFKGHSGKVIIPDRVKSDMLAGKAGYHELIAFYQTLYSRCENKAFDKLAVRTAVGWQFQIDPVDAEDFWTTIITGEGGGFVTMKKGVDPRKLLKKCLLTSVTSQHIDDNKRKEGVKMHSAASIFYTCNKYWNYWRDSRSDISLARVATKPIVPK